MPTESATCTRASGSARRTRTLRQALELLRQAGQTARPAREQDLGDRERAGLSLVELKRGDEVARERLQLAPHRLARACRLPLVAVGAGVPAVSSDSGALQLGRLGGVDAELALDRGDERGCRPTRGRA